MDYLEFGLMWQNVNLKCKVLVMFSPIFMADTKIIYGYNFVASLMKHWLMLNKKFAYVLIIF